MDDGSTDSTAAATETFAAADFNIRLLRNPGNRGKGFSVRRGMLTRTEWRLFTDADLSAPIAPNSGAPWKAAGARTPDRHRLARHRPFADRRTPAWPSRTRRQILQLRHAAGHGNDISDTQCGFKFFRGDVARQIFCASASTASALMSRCCILPGSAVIGPRKSPYTGTTPKAAKWTLTPGRPSPNWPESAGTILKAGTHSRF